MKLYISCDIEGVAGVPSWEYGSRNKLDYSEGRLYMIGEVNAAIEGALESGAEEIIVNDSHGNMVNLLPAKVNKAARLLQGEVKPWSMMEGMDKRYDAAAFIGYHAMAGTQFGSMAHTYCGAITAARVNGEVWGESEFNGAFCGAHGTPLVFLSGDEAVTKEVKKFIPKIETAAVKKGYGMRAALSVHPEVAQQMIREGIMRGLARRREVKPFLPKSPYTLEVDLRDPDMADICTRIPCTERIAQRTIRFSHRNYKEIYRAFLNIMSLASRV
jgi:D-amino peptidase